MANYAFAMPILPGKTELWKKYVYEMKNARGEEFKRSREKGGIRLEQVWLQNTPMGDFAIVYWDVDNPKKVFDYFMRSTDSFDMWFKDKILTECHGMKTGDPIPPINEQVLDNKTFVGEKTYEESRKR